MVEFLNTHGSAWHRSYYRFLETEISKQINVYYPAHFHFLLFFNLLDFENNKNFSAASMPPYLGVSAILFIVS